MPTARETVIGMLIPTRRRAVPALACMAGFLLLAVLYVAGWSGLYRGIIKVWGIAPFRFPFFDTDTVLSAVRCLRRGVDVYVTNPCDALGRVYDYSPLWMGLAIFPVTPAWLVPIGLALDGAFLVSLWLLPAGRGRAEVALITLGVLSSGVVFALERGNNDLVLFVLAAVTATLACRSPAVRLVGYAAAFLAGLLKYYPMLLMVVAVRERPMRLVRIALASAAVLALFVVSCWHDLTRALRLIPTGSYFGDMFGSITVAGGLGEVFGLSQATVGLIRGAMSLAALAIGIRLSMRPGIVGAIRDLGEDERSFLLVGALLLLGCFFTAQNIGYRVIHIILVLPALTALGWSGRHRLFRATAIMALALLWSEAWRDGRVIRATWLSQQIREQILVLTWLARETMWWWLVTVLIAGTVVLLRQSVSGSWLIQHLPATRATARGS
ncbi:hypothetical protein [Lichenicola sp.]|uniref:hypothetical protein n=1 Tax=Lichenicola sp. TaxID=2804529 RepID=UPI003AFFD8E5